MIKDFGNKIASDLFHKGECKQLPRAYWRRATFLMDIMDAVESFDDLVKKSFPPSIRLHQLKGDRKGEWAIDIHKTSGWRITFSFSEKSFFDVKIEDYH
jgi:proteic killer suppression protein